MSLPVVHDYNAAIATLPLMGSSKAILQGVCCLLSKRPFLPTQIAIHKIATASGVSLNTARRHLSWLEKYGYLKVERQYSAELGKLPSLYSLTPKILEKCTLRRASKTPPTGTDSSRHLALV